MPLTAVSTVTVTGSYLRPDGSPATGTVTFTPSRRLVTSADEQVVHGSIVATLNGAGDLTVELAATDDPDLGPAGWSWNAREEIDGRVRSFGFFAPLASDPLDLAELTPVDPVSPASVYVRVDQVDLGDLGDVDTTGALDGDRLIWDDTLEEWVPSPPRTAPVSSVNGHVGAVVLTPGDVGADPAGTAAGLVATESAARAGADTAEATARAAAVTAEATARANGDAALAAADVALDARLDTVETTLPTKADLVAGVIPDAQIPAGITRDAELSAAVAAAVNGLLDGAPGALNTLRELADAIGDDANFAASVTAALAAKAAIDGSNIVPATWRAVLALGTSATRNVGTVAGTVAAGDDARLTDTRTPTDTTVTTAKIVDAAVTTPKIGDAQVTPAKLSFDPATQVELDAETAARTAADTAVKAGAMGVVNHGAVAGTARPAGYAAIHWLGSVEPTNAVDGDVWTNTA